MFGARDMAAEKSLPSASEHRAKGESSIGAEQKGLDAALKAAASVGKVTRARFEPLRDRKIGDSWGIVHLYRDGEDLSGLPEVEVYHSEKSVAAGKAVASGGFGAAGDYNNQGEDRTILCIPAVPTYFTPSDFLRFVGERSREEVSHFRMVMTGQNNMYLVLMKFRDGDYARKWKGQWNGKLFNSMEPETCYVAFIKSITFQTEANAQSNISFPELSYDPFSPSNSASASLKPYATSATNTTELPTCPVCLDRMDDSTGLVTILCQHVFHGDCIQKWRGPGCPVCRRTNPTLASTSFQYDPMNPPFGSGEAPLCSICDTTEDLWICLVCGNVGCGRYKGGHQKEHWKETAHNLALEIETTHIWDYADDSWAHRLIRGKPDSKIMDEPPSSEMPPAPRSESDAPHEVPLTPSAPSVTNPSACNCTCHANTEVDLDIRLGHMLQPILDQQRAFFEEKVEKATQEAEAATASAIDASERAEKAEAKFQESASEQSHLQEEVNNLEKDLAREKTKAAKSTTLAKAMTKSFQDEKQLSAGLMENNSVLTAKLEAAAKAAHEQKEKLADMEEQIRDLYMNIEARDKLQQLNLEEGELEGSSVSVPEQKKPGKGKGKKR